MIGEKVRLTLAILLGAAIAFPAGMMVAGRGGEAERSPRPGGSAATGVRNAFSPDVLTDPYVVGQQRQLVEALEMQCRRSGERCAEAGQARQWLEKVGE